MRTNYYEFESRLKSAVDFGAGKWFLFAILIPFTYGLSCIGFAICGLGLRRRNWFFDGKQRIVAPNYILDLYKTSGNTIIKASVIAFIAVVIFTAAIISQINFLIASTYLLCVGTFIALPIWGHGKIKTAIAKATAQWTGIETEKQKANEDAELAQRSQDLTENTPDIIENTPAVPRYPEGISNQEFRSVIAGIGHHYDYYGGFAGYIVPEPNNPYDRNAMAIYILGKRIGYIPRRDNVNYRHWCDNQPMPCVGCIYENDEYKKVGVIRAIRYTNDETLRTIANDFFDWFRSNGMSELVPDKLEFGVKIEPEAEDNEK